MKYLSSIFFLLTLIFFSVFSLAIFSVKNNYVLADDTDTHVEVITVCGDGFTDPGTEFCDPGNSGIGVPPDVGTSTCQDFIDPDNASSTPYASGTLSCLNDCSYYSTSTCYTCGNNSVKPPMEECDGTDFGGITCATYGYNTGSLSCTFDCRLDLSDCSVVGEEEPEEGAEPWTGGGGGGGSRQPVGYRPGQTEEPRLTKVIINGKSYPNSDVRVLIDGEVVGIVKANAKGDFDFLTEDVTAGINTFGLWSEDTAGLKSTLLTLTFRVASKSITTISNAFISPTIDIEKNKYKKGEMAKLFGASFPESGIRVQVHSENEIIIDTTSNDQGRWEHIFSTENLENDFHTAKAASRLGDANGIIESNFSRTVSFYVGDDVIPEDECGIADLNCDGSVNLVDFSILLFHWSTSEKTADVNKDGSVGLVDFSIMLFYWTG